MNKIKVAIADDYKVYRDGLKVVLSADEKIEIICEAQNGEELIKKIATNLPDVIIMDLKMPVMDGMEATTLIRKIYSHVKILVVTMYDDEKFITHLAELGANGYLLKNAESIEIIKSIHSVHDTGYYFNSQFNEALLRRINSKKNS